MVTILQLPRQLVPLVARKALLVEWRSRQRDNVIERAQPAAAAEVGAPRLVLPLAVATTRPRRTSATGVASYN